MSRLVVGFLGEYAEPANAYAMNLNVEKKIFASLNGCYLKGYRHFILGTKLEIDYALAACMLRFKTACKDITFDCFLNREQSFFEPPCLENDIMQVDQECTKVRDEFMARKETVFNAIFEQSQNHIYAENEGKKDLLSYYNGLISCCDLILVLCRQPLKGYLKEAVKGAKYNKKKVIMIAL